MMPPIDDAPIYHPLCGPIVGWRDGPVIRFTGIPYAAAMRFGEPQAIPDRADLFVATTWSVACPQTRSPLIEHMCGGRGLAQLHPDENCQQLSVTVPADAHPAERLPVMVWIHGGSYISGAGDSPMTDPVRLVADERVIVVAVTYRLGLFGYLGADERPANLGLLDQREALRWVGRNIAAFGGDPENITAFGESAGGDAVVHLLALAHGERLFHRAIVQSAPLGIVTARSPMTAAMTRAAQHLDAEMTTEAILALQEEVLRSAARFGLRGGMAFGVQYGHEPLPAEEQIAEAWDKAADVPLLIGTNADESTFFIPAVPALQRLSRVPLLGRALIGLLVRFTTWAVYRRDAGRFAERHVRAGGIAYRYALTWSAPGNRIGSAHGIDLALLFGREDTWGDAAMLAGASWEEIDRAGSAVRAIWAGFARGAELALTTTIPGVITVQRWPRPPRLETETVSGLL